MAAPITPEERARRSPSIAEAQRRYYGLPPISELAGIPLSVRTSKEYPEESPSWVRRGESTARPRRRVPHWSETVLGIWSLLESAFPGGGRGRGAPQAMRGRISGPVPPRKTTRQPLPPTEEIVNILGRKALEKASHVITPGSPGQMSRESFDLGYERGEHERLTGDRQWMREQLPGGTQGRPEDWSYGMTNQGYLYGRLGVPVHWADILPRSEIGAERRGFSEEGQVTMRKMPIIAQEATAAHEFGHAFARKAAKGKLGYENPNALVWEPVKPDLYQTMLMNRVRTYKSSMNSIRELEDVIKDAEAQGFPPNEQFMHPMFEEPLTLRQVKDIHQDYVKYALSNEEIFADVMRTRLLYPELSTKKERNYLNRLGRHIPDWDIKFMFPFLAGAGAAAGDIEEERKSRGR